MIQCYYLFSSHFHHPFQRKELVKDFGVYVKFVDLEQCGTKWYRPDEKLDFNLSFQ